MPRCTATTGIMTNAGTDRVHRDGEMRTPQMRLPPRWPPSWLLLPFPRKDEARVSDQPRKGKSA